MNGSQNQAGVYTPAPPFPQTKKRVTLAHPLVLNPKTASETQKLTAAPLIVTRRKTALPCENKKLEDGYGLRTNANNKYTIIAKYVFRLPVAKKIYKKYL